MTEQQTKNQNSKFKIQNYLLPLPHNWQIDKLTN